MGKVAKVVAGGGVFLGSFVVFQMFSGCMRPPTPQETQAQLDKEVAKLKPTLPKKVHPMVTWFDVESGPQTIIYKYKIHAPRSTVMAKRADMEKEMKNSSMIGLAKLMLPKGTKIQCDLYDEREAFLFSLDLD